MKDKATLILVLLPLLFMACSKEEPDQRSKYLTASAWGKPAIIEIVSGFLVLNSCPEGNYFQTDGQYSHHAFCPTYGATSGTWKWTDDGYLLITMDGSGALDKMQILELSDTLMHIKRYLVKVAEGKTYYVGEFKYRHNPGAK